MTNTCSNSCGTNCSNVCMQCAPTNNGISNYAFILVLFILLVICGAAFIF